MRLGGGERGRGGRPRVQVPTAWWLPALPPGSSSSARRGPDARTWAGEGEGTRLGRSAAWPRAYTPRAPVLTPVAGPGALGAGPGSLRAATLRCVGSGVVARLHCLERL